MAINENIIKLQKRYRVFKRLNGGHCEKAQSYSNVTYYNYSTSAGSLWRK